MKVLHTASEMAPFAKVGGLADVIQSLPLAQRDLKIDARVVIPAYKCVKESCVRLKTAAPKCRIKMGEDSVEAEFFEIADYALPVYLIDAPEYFGREGIYGATAGKGFEDNPERYVFFSQAILRLINAIDWKPDILHCHDWQTALLPALLSQVNSRPGTLLTIHNLVYQGVYEWSRIKKILTLDEDKFPPSEIDFFGKFNLLKLGILTADKINTVSPGYRDETLSGGEFGAGLEDVLQKRSADFSGILNGIDYGYWNPATDDKIVHRFNGDWMDFKDKNKSVLLGECDFPENGEIALGMVGRLVHQKGIDLLLEAIDDLLERNCHLVILGSGFPEFEEKLEMYAEKYPRCFYYDSSYNEILAHRIYAGTDLFLMPSRFEPCGLSQMIAMRYGSIPIVREVGGLKTSVMEFESLEGEGNGFKFLEYTPETLLRTIDKAIDCINDRSKREILIDNAVKEDFTWERSARVYKKLYQEILD